MSDKLITATVKEVSTHLASFVKILRRVMFSLVLASVPPYSNGRICYVVAGTKYLLITSISDETMASTPHFQGG